ncbi:MAG: transglutaminase-like domain-containing protein [Chloroflexota bacterium]
MDTHSERQWDWLLAILLVSAMLTSAGRLAVTTWTPELETAQVMAGLGALLGLVIGYSRFGRRGLVGLALGYGLAIYPWYLGWIETPYLPPLERLLSLGGRLLFSIGLLFRGEPVKDHVFFVTLLSIVYWAISVSAGFTLQRRANLLGALIPAGIVLLVVHGYDSYFTPRITFVAVYIFLSLALAGRVYFLKQRAAWQAKKIYQTAEAGPVMVNSLLVASAFIVLLTWTLPASATSLAVAADAWKQLTRPWREAQDDMSDAFAALESTVNLRREYFGDTLPLGNSVPENESVVFVVQVTDKPFQPPRMYWRGRIYDAFDGRQWSTSEPVGVVFTPENGDLNVPDKDNPDVMSLKVQNRINNLGLVYAMPQTVWISRPATAQSYVREDGVLDLVMLNPNPRIAAGEVFETRAAVSNPSISELRAAGEEYPDWVVERYLDVPDNFSPRLRALAAEVTVNAENPYDKAAVITLYLRRNVAYSRTLPDPPAGRDPLEWIILEHKQAFCNYYATAEVLMLRSLGIPARMALGYSQGDYNGVSGEYTVRQSNYHAWPEVYFPGIGWVEFEPTVNQNPLVRPPGELDNNEGGPNANPLPEELLPQLDGGETELPLPEESAAADAPSLRSFIFDWQPLFRTLGWMLAIAAVIWFWYLDQQRHLVDRIPSLLKANLERRNIATPRWLDRWAFYVTLNPVARAYRIIPWSLRWLGGPVDPAHTPAEQARQLGESLPSAALSIRNLLHEYQKSVYSPEPGDIFIARRANRLILQAATQAWGRTLLQSIRRRSAMKAF